MPVAMASVTALLSFFATATVAYSQQGKTLDYGDDEYNLFPDQTYVAEPDIRLRALGSLNLLDERDILNIFQTQESSETGCSCGIAKSARILGGKDVSIPQKYPWTVLVKQIENYIPKKTCAGSIISDTWVLTAAHCVVTQNKCLSKGGCKFPSKQCFLKRKSKKTFTQVTVGDHHLHKEDDDVYDLFKNIKVTREYIHPKFTDCNAKHYDFALLKLDEILNFGEHLMPVCLPTDDMSSFGGQTGTVIGWGRDEIDSFASSTTLKEHETKILNQPWCGLWNNQGDISPSQLCAGGEVSEEGICHGDTGGPLMITDDKGHYVVVGVASFVYENCGQKYWPDVYGRVTEVNTWISHLTANKTCSK